MRQLGVIVALLVLVATACSGSKKPGAAGTQPAQALAATPAAPSPSQCPLTGLAPPAGVQLTRPLLAVKIDGSQASKSPSGQSGLDAADVVYDEPVEGGFGWFLALYHCGDPSRVGPIRDARKVDPGILAQYGSALLATAAVPADVKAQVTGTAGLVSIDSVHHGTAFFRDTVVRKAPYNLFADPARLRAVRVPGTALKPLAEPVSQFQFVSPTAGVSPSASHKAASIKFKLGPSISYSYDAGGTSYLRSENGQAHLTDTGSQIRVTNVVIMWATMNQIQVTGTAGTTTIPDPVLTGQGNTMVLSGGVEYDGQWSRTDLASPMHLLDSKGNLIPLIAGNTWIHILPKEEPVFVQ